MGLSAPFPYVYQLQNSSLQLLFFFFKIHAFLFEFHITRPTATKVRGFMG